MGKKVNLLPTTPKGIVRLALNVAQNEGITFEKKIENLEFLGNCYVIVQELKDRGELSDEKAEELVKSHIEKN